MLLAERDEPRTTTHPRIDMLPSGLNEPLTAPGPRFTAPDFDRAPMVVIWEMTRACDLACRHCRASARPKRDAGELTTLEAIRLIGRVREFGGDHGPSPLFILTGGDPLKRPDLISIVEFATGAGLRVALAASGTPLVTRNVLEDLRGAGLARLAMSLDGSTPGIHDRFRGVAGSYECTLTILREARAVGLSTQVNTTISRHNLDDLEPLIRSLDGLGIDLWSVFFIVPTGRARRSDLTTPEEFERVFHRLVDLSEIVPFDIKTTAAPHYRRVVLQRRAVSTHANGGASRDVGFSVRDRRAGGQGVNDGRGFVFVSHRGDIQPSGFLPLAAGNVRGDDLVDVYRNSELFRSLRDRSRLKGKCKACEFNRVCGGSRARAYAMTGDYLEADPSCAYIPPKYATTEDTRA